MGFFSAPKPPPAPVYVPPPEPTAPPPTEDNSADELAQASADAKDKARKQKGRAATLLTGGQGTLGDDSSAGVATKKLLGGG